MTPLHRCDLYFTFREMSLQEDKASDCLNCPSPIPNPLHLLTLFPGIISFRKPSRIENLKLAYSIISCVYPSISELARHFTCIGLTIDPIIKSLEETCFSPLPGGLKAIRPIFHYPIINIIVKVTFNA